jgi:hypothetical protein
MMLHPSSLRCSGEFSLGNKTLLSDAQYDTERDADVMTIVEQA